MKRVAKTVCQYQIRFISELAVKYPRVRRLRSGNLTLIFVQGGAGPIKVWGKVVFDFLLDIAYHCMIFIQGAVVLVSEPRM